MKNEFIYPTNETDWLMWVKFAFLLLFFTTIVFFSNKFSCNLFRICFGSKTWFWVACREAKATEPNCKNVVSAIYSIIVVQYKGGGTGTRLNATGNSRRGQSPGGSWESIHRTNSFRVLEPIVCFIKQALQMLH